VPAQGAQSGDPFLVVTPAGPKLPLERVLSIARGEAQAAGDENPPISWGEGTLQEAKRTIDPSDATTEPTDPGLRSQLERPVDLVVMTGHFTLGGVSVPLGGGVPVGEVLDLVIDSHSGEVVGRALPLPGQQSASRAAATNGAGRRIALHTVPRLNTGPSAVKSAPAPLGRVVGVWKGKGRIVAFRGKTVLFRTRPGPNGRFVLPLIPGEYEVAVKRPSGRYCPAKHVVVQAEREIEVTLTCPKQTTAPAFAARGHTPST
jgi:hypothetical protein